MAEINVNIKSTIERNRVPFSILGGKTLGQDVFRPEMRECQEKKENGQPSVPYAEKIKAIMDEGNLDLCLNRTPRKFRIVSTTIVNVGIGTSITGEAVVMVNQKKDGTSDIEIPIEDATKFGVIDRDAVEAMIKGTSKNVAVNPAKLNMFIEALNVAEIRRLDNLASLINTFKSQIQSTIGENAGKVKTYNEETKHTEGTVTANISVEQSWQSFFLKRARSSLPSCSQKKI